MELKPGNYMITYNEIVHIPTNLRHWHARGQVYCAAGSASAPAVWDAGISGVRSRLMNNL